MLILRELIGGLFQIATIAALLLIPAGTLQWTRANYFSFLLFFLGLALWLESYASAVALLLPVACFVARISVEEKTPQETLPGYAGYLKRVRLRLVPFVW